MKNFTLKILILAFGIFYFGNLHSQEIIDLTGIDNPNILADTLPDVASGSEILLEPGKIYNAGGYAFDKSVTVKSSEPNNLNLPKIDLSANYNFADGATIDSLVFMNIEFFYESFDDKYIINSNVSATIGKFILDGCYIHDLRGVLRMKDNGPGSLDYYIIKNCKINMIRDYGILTVDRDDWACNNILIQNSTLSKIRAFMTSKNNTNTLNIDGCTLNEVTSAGQRMFRWRTGGQDNVTGGITIKNTVWGPGWDEEGTGSTGFDGYDGLGATNWSFENVHATSDLVFASGKDTIKGFDKVYANLATDLWVNPAEGNLNYKDAAFAGIGNAGDQRWGVATDDNGVEWNIGSEAFNAQGEMDMTKKLAGLTIYAHSGKKVTIEENNKSLDGTDYTHRLKLGGSGDFDDNGQPKGRVLAIDVMGNTNITVIAMSSTGSEDRILNIAAGSKNNVIAEFPALGASISKGVYFYKGGPSKLYFYSPNSGVNVYYLKAAAVPTGIQEIKVIKPPVNIYPNPATDKVFIDVKEPTQIGIYNIAGSLMKQQMVYSKNEHIDISDLTQGIYFVRSQKNNAFAKKLIVK